MIATEGASLEASTVAVDPPERFSGISVSSFPNPMSTQATLEVALDAPSRVRIDLYDLLGRHVSTLADRLFEAGNHTLPVDASILPSGPFYYRASTGLGGLTTGSLVVRR
ncbi:MAG: hypothetical protein ACI80V_002422 [Rhodothermales bacterium]|jgi:hypothetical protein